MDVWGEKKIGINPLYAFDPMPVLKEASNYIWTVYTEKRFADSANGAVAELLISPVIAGERTMVEGLPVLQERLLELAPTLGFEVIE